MTFTPNNMPAVDPVFLSPFSMSGFWRGYRMSGSATPASGTFTGAGAVVYQPIYIARPYTIQRWWWLNGATTGTDYVQVAIYDSTFTRVAASPQVLSAGSANVIQTTTHGIAGANLYANSSSTDAASYTTFSATLKAGTLYLMAVENSHGSSASAVSSISSGPTFTSRSSVQFNSSLNRISIWSAVPATDYTGTLAINFGGTTQTGACWSLCEFNNVDTASNDGIVQNATGTGSSTTPLATLSAFGSANNATFGAFGVASAASGTPSTGYLELSDGTASTPAQALQTDFRTDNDTTVDETIASNPWGAAAVEIKSRGTGPFTIPPVRGYMATWCSGSTATLFRAQPQAFDYMQEGGFYVESSGNWLRPTASPQTMSSGNIYVCGITNRSTP